MNGDGRKLGCDRCPSALFLLPDSDATAFTASYRKIVDAGSVRGDTEYPAKLTHEHEFVTALACHEWREHVAEKCGVGDCAAFMVFDVPPDDLSVDFGYGFGDVDAPAEHVE